ATICGSVHALKTISRGALKTRVMTRSCASSRAALLLFLFSLLLPAMFLLLVLQLAQVFVQSVEALLPEFPVFLHPLGDLFEPGRLEPAGTPLRVAAALDEAGALEHL